MSDSALARLLTLLDAAEYVFTTVTPDSHARVLARPRPAGPATLRDAFGWSRDFAPGDLPADLFAALEEADGVEPRPDGRLRSRLRASSLEGRLFLHSAYPTEAEDSVFFGPDTYRFAAFVRAELAGTAPVSRLLDIGTGSGAGAVTAAALCGAREVFMTDINPRALRLARVNAAHAGIAAHTLLTGDLSGVPDGLDVALANPPFIVDAAERSYRHGGDLHGGRLSLDMAQAALPRLAPGGRLLLYTGAAIVDGANPLLDHLRTLAVDHASTLTAREIDPDIFGEELSRPAYAAVDRIAAIGVTITRPA